MIQLLGILDNALLQGLSYGIAGLGVAVAFRVLRYPDLTADGSFLLGGAVLAAVSSSGLHWSAGTLLAVAAGSGAGLVTAFMNVHGGVSRLLSGILTTMIVYSLAFHVLGGRSNVGLLEVSTIFAFAEGLDDAEPYRSLFLHPGSLVVLAILIAAVLALLETLLKSDFGLFLRAVGGNPALVESLGCSTLPATYLGLALANGLIALSGAVVASRQGFADVNMGTGIIITLIAGLVVGETATRRLMTAYSFRLGVGTLAPVLGLFVYFLLYLLILRASILGWVPFRIQPTDLRLLSALVLAAAIALRFRGTGATGEEVLPL